MKIAMLLTNPFWPDPRVLKEARSLAQANYEVTVICWDRQAEFAPMERVEGFEVRRLAIQSGFAVGSRQVLFLPRFWWQALNELNRLQPQIIHCHDLDTTPPGYWYARQHRIPWIFDSHECYPEGIGPQVNRPIYYALLWLERIMTRRASHVITVGELLAQRFRKFGGRATVVGNYQSLNPARLQSSLSRTELGLGPDELIVVYAGGFTLPRALIPLMESTATVPGVTVFLLGDGVQRTAVEANLPQYPQVRYLGWVPQSEALDYIALADVVYYGLDIHHRHSQYSAPNALFNALAAGKPVLTTDIGEIAHIVQQENCGVVVQEATPTLLSSALNHLRDPAFRLPLAKNASRAAENKYNWSAAEMTLLRLYAEMTD